MSAGQAEKLTEPSIGSTAVCSRKNSAYQSASALVFSAPSYDHRFMTAAAADNAEKTTAELPAQGRHLLFDCR